MITHSKFLLLIFLLCSCQDMFKSKEELYYKKRTDSLNAQKKTVQDTTLEIPPNSLNTLGDITQDTILSQTERLKLAKLDTTIFLNMPKSVGGNGKKVTITNEFVENLLYKYHKSKGILSNIAYENGLYISVDTVYLIDLNRDRHIDCIVSYLLTPFGASSNYFQSTKAILLNNKGKLKIQDIDFIPANYSIDSVKLVNDSAKIYCCDYDCINRRVIRNFEITLQGK